MSEKWKKIGETGLSFFGSVTASVSHEIKNSLAIINENTGLINDFVMLGLQGRPVDLERLKSISEKIINQIKRADNVVKNLNHFAHSTDSFLKSIDIAQDIGHTVSLYQRAAAGRKVSIKTIPFAVPVTFEVNPFFFKNLIGRCLDFSIKTAEIGQTIEILQKCESDIVTIIFTPINILQEAEKDFPFESLNVISEAVNADVKIDLKNHALVIKMLKKLSK